MAGAAAPVSTPRGYLWSPGVKVGVQPGSMFHLTECFGPVLGRHAGRRPGRGHPLAEPARLRADGRPARPRPGRDRPLAGARSTPATCTSTGAPPVPSCAGSRSGAGSVRWSGPGAKAGGPNYVASLGTWPTVAAGSDRRRLRGRPAGRPGRPCGVPRTRPAWPPRPTPSGTGRCGTVAAVPGGPGVADAEAGLRPGGAAAVGVRRGRRRGRRAVGRAPPVDKVRFLGSVDDATRLAAHDAGWWVDDIPVAADPAPGDPALGARAGGQRTPAPPRQRHRPAAGSGPVATDPLLRVGASRASGGTGPSTGARPGPATASWWPWAACRGPFDRDADPTHVTGSALVVGPRGVLLHRHKRLGPVAAAGRPSGAGGDARGPPPGGRRRRRPGCRCAGRRPDASRRCRRWPTSTCTTGAGATPTSTCATCSRSTATTSRLPRRGRARTSGGSPGRTPLAIADPGLVGFLRAHRGDR